MARPKKYTEEIFDALKDAKRRENYLAICPEWEIFEALVQARLRKGYKQESLAKKAEISLATIAKIEAARANPTISTLVKLARQLDMEIKAVRKVQNEPEIIKLIQKSSD